MTPAGWRLVLSDALDEMIRDVADPAPLEEFDEAIPDA